MAGFGKTGVFRKTPLVCLLAVVGCVAADRAGTIEAVDSPVVEVGPSVTLAPTTQPTSQPAVDVATIKAELQTDLAAEVAAIRADIRSTRTVTYAGGDVWLGRLAVALAIVGAFAFAAWQARRHGYRRQRAIRLRHDRAAQRLRGIVKHAQKLVNEYGRHSGQNGALPEVLRADLDEMAGRLKQGADNPVWWKIGKSGERHHGAAND